jgi:hypothetical protein
VVSPVRSPTLWGRQHTPRSRRSRAPKQGAPTKPPVPSRAWRRGEHSYSSRGMKTSPAPGAWRRPLRLALRARSGPPPVERFASLRSRATRPSGRALRARLRVQPSGSTSLRLVPEPSGRGRSLLARVHPPGPALKPTSLRRSGARLGRPHPGTSGRSPLRRLAAHPGADLPAAFGLPPWSPSPPYSALDKRRAPPVPIVGDALLRCPKHGTARSIRPAPAFADVSVDLDVDMIVTVFVIENGSLGPRSTTDG